MDTIIEITDTPASAALEFLGKNLAAFNDNDVGPSQRRPLAVFVRDAQGAVLAGISGYTAWGWLYIQWLWVDEALRGQGMASRMLDSAEKEGAARGCHGALIDTFNPVALKTYERQGYEIFGALADFPMGRSRSFLQKKLHGKL